jgi:hypothetical protein
MDLERIEARLKELGGHGILNASDIEEIDAACRRVLHLMLDRLLFCRENPYVTAEEIKLAAGKNGVPASEGLRRMRELRRFFDIVRRRRQQNRQFEYAISGLKR